MANKNYNDITFYHGSKDKIAKIRLNDTALYCPVPCFFITPNIRFAYEFAFTKISGLPTKDIGSEKYHFIHDIRIIKQPLNVFDIRDNDDYEDYYNFVKENHNNSLKNVIDMRNNFLGKNNNNWLEFLSKEFKDYLENRNYDAYLEMDKTNYNLAILNLDAIKLVGVHHFSEFPELEEFRNFSIEVNGTNKYDAPILKYSDSIVKDIVNETGISYEEASEWLKKEVAKNIANVEKYNKLLDENIYDAIELSSSIRQNKYNSLQMWRIFQQSYANNQNEEMFRIRLNRIFDDLNIKQNRQCFLDWAVGVPESEIVRKWNMTDNAIRGVIGQFV
jgi:hypothetical protein